MLYCHMSIENSEHCYPTAGKQVRDILDHSLSAKPHFVFLKTCQGSPGHCFQVPNLESLLPQTTFL